MTRQVRLAELGTAQRRLVLALIEAAASAERHGGVSRPPDAAISRSRGPASHEGAGAVCPPEDRTVRASGGTA